IGRIAAFRLADLVDEPLGRGIIAMADELARLSDRPDGLSCAYLTPAHRATAALLRDWMLAAGLEAEIDAVGNVIGRWRNSAASKRTLVTGSHYDTVVADGVSLRQALASAGHDAAGIPAVAFDPKTLLGFVEVHIEQGPALLNAGAPLGVVTSIAGSIRSLVSITGLAGHAGTVPMQGRRDAAAAAGELILAVEKRCGGTPGLVGTVGQLQVPGGAINVIPGRCELSVDIRADRTEVRDAAYASVVAESERIAASRQVAIVWDKALDIACVPCSPDLQQRLVESITR